MPHSIEFPEAPRFPEQNKKLDVILDTLTIHHAADVLIAKFKTLYGVSETGEENQLTGSSFFSPLRDLEIFATGLKSDNPVFCSELIRIIYAMDRLEVKPEKQAEWFTERMDIDAFLSQVFDSSSWLRYLDTCELTEDLHVAQAFWQYQTTEELKRPSQLEKMYQMEFKRLSKHDQEKNSMSYEYEDDAAENNSDEKRSKRLRLFSYQLQTISKLAARLGDEQKIQQIIDLHYDDSFVHSKFETDQTFRKNIQTLIDGYFKSQPNNLKKVMHSENTKRQFPESYADYESRHSHLVLLAAYSLHDWQLFYDVVAEGTVAGMYELFQLELLARFLEENQEIPPDARKKLESHLVYCIKQLSEKEKFEILASFQHPELVSDCIDVLLFVLQGGYFNEQSYRTILKFVIENASPLRKKQLVSRLDAFISKQVSFLEAADEREENEKESSEKKRQNLSGSALSMAAEIGMYLNQIRIVENVSELAFREIGDEPLGNSVASEVIQKSVPTLINSGNSFIVNNLIKMSTDIFRSVKEISATSELINTPDNLSYLIDSLPIMQEVLRQVSLTFPSMMIEIDNQTLPIALFQRDISTQVVHFLDWISKRELLESESEDGEMSGQLLELGKALLKSDQEPEVLKKVKTILLTESIRQLALEDHTTASNYLVPLMSHLGADWSREADLLQFISEPDFNWIVRALFPIAKPAIFLSHN